MGNTYRKKSTKTRDSACVIHPPPSIRESLKLNPGSIGPLLTGAPLLSCVGAGGSGLPFRFATALSISVTPAPYDPPAIDILKNSMELQVRVPEIVKAKSVSLS